MLNHFNQDYDGGSPNIPESVGDRFYAQDMVRDFWYNLNETGKSVKELFSTYPILLENAVVVQGSSLHEIDIPISKGWCNYEVRIPDSFSGIPPTSKLDDIVVKVESVAVTDLDIQATATLDGATTNYVKLRYNETDGSTRQRAKKAGTYVYEKVPSYEIVVNSTANTDYDILLATLVGDDSTFLTITNQSATLLKGQTKLIANAYENITKNDPVGIDNVNEEIAKSVKKFMLSSYTKAASTGSETMCFVSQLGTTDNFVAFWNQDGVGASDGMYCRIGHLSGTSIVWDTSATAASTLSTGFTAAYMKIIPYSTDKFCCVWTETGIGSWGNIGRLSGGAIVWDIFEDAGGFAGIVNKFDIIEYGSDIALVYEDGSSQIDMDVIYDGGGGTFALRNSATLSNIFTGAASLGQIGGFLSNSMCNYNNGAEIFICAIQSNAVYGAFTQISGTTLSIVAAKTLIRAATCQSSFTCEPINNNQNSVSMHIMNSTDNTSELYFAYRSGSSVILKQYTSTYIWDSMRTFGEDQGVDTGFFKVGKNYVLLGFNGMAIIRLNANVTGMEIEKTIFRERINFTFPAGWARFTDNMFFVWLADTSIQVFRYIEGIGLAETTVTAGNPCTVLLNTKADGFSGLQIGEKYFVDYENETVGLFPSETELGVAVSATEILVK